MSPTALPDLAALVAVARAARANAYAPYSRYAVGSAVLTDDGRTFSGVNVENASYGATVCAERVAVWTAVAAGARRVVAVAVVTAGGGSPCGLCRQVLAEFADAAMPIAMAAPDGDPTVRTLGELLPLAWTAADLTR
ncbi:MAG: cytidine deaminase [Ardenticatenales bacterium]|nr:cytidine deaminase [Ardenticatenales bacterium]